MRQDLKGPRHRQTPTRNQSALSLGRKQHMQCRTRLKIQRLGPPHIRVVHKSKCRIWGLSKQGRIITDKMLFELGLKSKSRDLDFTERTPQRKDYYYMLPNLHFNEVLAEVGGWWGGENEIKLQSWCSFGSKRETHTKWQGDHTLIAS